MTLDELHRALPDTISAPDLMLRAPLLEDADQLQQRADNEKIHKVLARLPYPYTKDHAVQFITELARTDDEHAYAIIRNNQFIGVIGLHFGGPAKPELGYWLGEPYWGHGFATQAAIAVIGAARAIDSGLTIYSRAISSNGASRRVLAKAGFIETGEGIDDCGQHEGVSVTTYRLGGDD